MCSPTSIGSRNLMQRWSSQGHLINMGSIAGHVAYPKGTGYNATKFAVSPSSNDS